MRRDAERGRLREERTAREHGVRVGPFGYLGGQSAGRDSGWRLGKRGVIGVRVREQHRVEVAQVRHLRRPPGRAGPSPWVRPRLPDRACPASSVGWAFAMPLVRRPVP